MPRATFLQSVLRKPTRKYADPSGASPYALDEEDDHYHAGPSRGYTAPSGRRDYRQGSDVGAGGYRYASGQGYNWNDNYDGYDGRGAGSDIGPSRSGTGQTEGYSADDWTREMRAQRKQPRKAQSVAHLPQVRQEYPDAIPEHLATRFPRPAKKAASSVVLRESPVGSTLVEMREGEDVYDEQATQGTVRRRKKKAVRRDEDDVGQLDDAASSRAPSVRSVATNKSRTKIKATASRGVPEVIASSSMPADQEYRHTRTTSSAQISSQPLPHHLPTPNTRPPPTSTVQIIKSSPASSALSPTPPASDRSSSVRSSADRMPDTPPDPKMGIVPQIQIRTAPSPKAVARSQSMRSAKSRLSVAESDDGDETAYFTPPSSPPGGVAKSSGRRPVQQPEPELLEEEEEEEGDASGDVETGDRVREREEEESEEPLVTPINEAQGPPIFTIQPPTPAPIPDSSESVFVTPDQATPPSITGDGTPSSDAKASGKTTPPDHLLKRAAFLARPALSTSNSTASAPIVMTQPQFTHPIDDDAQSNHAQPPSDDEADGDNLESSSHLSANPASRQGRPPSRPASVTHSAPLPMTTRERPHRHSIDSHARRSPRVSPNGGGSHSSIGDGRRGSMQMAELAAARPSREGSIRSSVSGFGFGKGGWAAAAASSQSGRNSPAPTPVMYMPTGSMDGWESFHSHAQQQPPPRQSRYTPLPPASQPMNFERLVNGLEAVSVGQSERSPSVSEASGPYAGVGAGGSSSRRVNMPILGAPEHALASEPSQYSDDASESSDSEDNLVDGLSRSYLAPTWTGETSSRSASGSEVSLGERDTRRRDASAYHDNAAVQTLVPPPAPPIPRKDPRRLSLDHSEAVQPVYDQHHVQSHPHYGHSPVQSRSQSHSQLHPPVDDDQSQYTYGSETYTSPEVPDSHVVPTTYSRPLTPDMPSRPLSPSGSIREFPRPSFLDPDVLTLLPEMTVEDSNNLYRSPTPSEGGARSRASWMGVGGGGGGGANAGGSGNGNVNGSNPYLDRAGSVSGLLRSKSMKEDDAQSQSQAQSKPPVSILIPHKDGSDVGGSETGSKNALLRAGTGKRASSAMGQHKEEKKSVHWEGSSFGEGVLMESNGREPERMGGYTTLVLPSGAYRPVDPERKRSSLIDHRILGMPSTSMAAITLSNAAHRLAITPMHLRGNLPLPVEFSSHLAPPSKVGSAQVLVQVYAVGIDRLDVRALEEKGKGEVGKWIPGRSFVGRCVSVGKDEREIVKGELVVGLFDLRKSGALTEYVLIDRRRVARAPHPTTLTLEQLSLLPLHAIPAARALRTPPLRNARALIQNAHSGIAALLCQDMARRGVHVTAIIPGGEASHLAQTRCMANGAKGVMTGAPAAVMFGLDDGGWDYVVDCVGGERVYEAARRLLKEGGRLISLVKATPHLPSSAQAASKPSGFRTLRAAFSGGSSKRRDTKHIEFTYIPPAGSGEPEVDSSGLDCRDVLEEQVILGYRPVVEGLWNFENGANAFGTHGGGSGVGPGVSGGGAGGGGGGTGMEVGVVRLIN